ncbi:MAG: phytanoyl-CoA dioxygenase family protein [Candidatus Hydrogenedentes bacterium]|nr:phytanoyl-CoA dioxygenase family protein [Candidatus Hydrogenedentota bacterium]
MAFVVDIPPLGTARPSDAQLAAWEAQLWEEGYLVLPGALPAPAVQHFAERFKHMPREMGYGTNSLVRLFEWGPDFVHLLENEPVITLMERILGKNLHIIALQGHRMFKGNEVLRWHSDEVYLERRADVPDSIEYPPIINVINCHYYLTDVPEELGPTQVVPGSHRACRQPRPEDGDPPHWRGKGPVSLTVKAGDCVMYSNQAWHRGSPNTTDQTRLAVVPAYARRFVAQRFWPFLNYHLSRDILDACTPRQRELLGEHGRGAYG